MQPETLIARLQKAADFTRMWRPNSGSDAIEAMESAVLALQEAETLRKAVVTVIATFSQDEVQGYHSRDRRYAIEVLANGLTTAVAAPETRETPEDRRRAYDHGPNGDATTPGFVKEPSR
jgi:hypothetical protein